MNQDILHESDQTMQSILRQIPVCVLSEQGSMQGKDPQEDSRCRNL